MISKLQCKSDTPLKEILDIFENAAKHHLPGSLALVVDENHRLMGTITDGDVRRAIIKHENLDLKAAEIMEKNPIVFRDGLTTQEILDALPDELAKRNRRSSKYLSKILFIDQNNVPVRVLEYHQLWELKVASHRHLVVIGLGYVGLTMSMVMADAGFLVTGVEQDQKKREILKTGKSYIHEIGLEELVRKNINRNFRVSEVIPSDGDVYIISVGTPVSKNADGFKRPTLRFLQDACEKIGNQLKHGNLVILRSTVPIGTCRSFVIKILESKSGLKCGLDFHLSFAPERTAEGKALKELRSLPQIIGGYNRDSLEATAAIFRDLTPTIVKVDSLEAAEMAKLINNSYRDYIFAYSNQIAQIGSKFNINVVDVINAANEGYPRDPVPLPSPGVGGPCLTKDPYIFSSSLAQNGSTDIFERGRSINESMHNVVFDSVSNQLEENGKDLRKSKILICGLSFKGNPETGDIRNSSGVEIAMLFKDKVEKVFGYDPVAQKSEILEYGIDVMDNGLIFNDLDAVLFLNNHKSFDKLNLKEMLDSMNNNPIIYDGWNLFRPADILTIRPCTYMGLSFVKSSI